MADIAILDVVRKSLAKTNGRPILAVQSENAPPQVMTSADVWTCMEQHRSWMERRLAKLSDFDQKSSDIVVAYLSSNSVDMLLSMLASTANSIVASSKQSCVSALLNTRWTPEEMIKALNSYDHKSMTLLLYGDGYERTAQQVVANLNHRSICLPLPRLSLQSLQSDGGLASKIKSPGIELNDNVTDIINQLTQKGSCRDAMIVFTSGTTGGSKGVRLSHRALAIQAMAKLAKPCNYDHKSILLATTVPLFHVGGISSCLAMLFAGGCLLFPSKGSQGFDPDTVKQTMVSSLLPINTLVVVPAMLVSLIASIDSTSIYPNIRLILIGGQSGSNQLLRKLSHVFPNARIIQTYACTEAASSLTFLPIDANSSRVRPKYLPGSPNGDCVGSPPPHVHLRLYRKEGKTTKIVTLPYQTGIIATRGPHLMNNYWQRGLSTAPSNLEGWYLSSDLGFWDEEGQLYFSGRVKDAIRSGGETVMAQEVERVLLQHPDIVEAAVFPRADDRFGEAVACALVGSKGSKSITLANIKDWCAQNGLANYKRPRFLFPVESLPRNTSGKVLKHKLIAQFGRIQSKL